MSEGLSAERLAELERVWEADPSSRAFVQLAEEYRRLGDLSRAAGVLQKGLESHPHYLSALVALGRCRFDLGDAEGAIEVLGRALAQDPSQLVANKLLVEAYLQTGEPDKAKERLDFYRLFNDRDEEIEALEQKIAAAASAPDEDVPLVPGTPRGDTVFELQPPSSLPPIQLDGPPLRPGPGRPRAAEPFGPLHDLASAARKIDVALAAGGVFAVETVVGAGIEVAEEAEPPDAPPWGPAASAAELEHEVVEEVVAEPFRPRTIGEEVERETIEEPFDEVLQAPSVGPRPIEEAPPRPVEASSEPVGEEAVEPEPAAAEKREEVPSSTLGELYLSQGHLDDAEAEFRRVLEARPDDAVAQTGLQEIERRRGPLDDTSAGWGDEASEIEIEIEAADDGPVSTPVGGGLTRRKVQTLRSYLDRLTRGRQRSDVP